MIEFFTMNDFNNNPIAPVTLYPDLAECMARIANTKLNKVLGHLTDEEIYKLCLDYIKDENGVVEEGHVARVASMGFANGFRACMKKMGVE